MKDIERLTAATARLRGELQRRLVDVPLNERTVHGLARRWGIDRNLTQRLLAGLNPARDELVAFAALPGVRGLASIVDVIERFNATKPRRRDSNLRTALEAYADAVRALGGSQSAIVRELSRVTKHHGKISFDAGGDDLMRDDVSRRPEEVAGCTIPLEYGISGVRPSRQYPGRWQNFVLSAYLGIRCLREGVSLTLQRTVTGSVAGEVLPEVTSRSLAELMDGKEGLLSRFGRGPAPRFSRRQVGGEERECLDLPVCDEPLDVVSGAVRDNIDSTPTPEGLCWGQGVRVRYPTRQLIFDHYVHRSLDEGWVAAGHCYWWTPTLIAHPQADWHERLAVPVRVERDESGAPAPALPEWDRARELNREVLAALNWRPADLVRYRVWVDRPVWGSMVYLSFLAASNR